MRTEHRGRQQEPGSCTSSVSISHLREMGDSTSSLTSTVTVASPASTPTQKLLKTSLSAPPAAPLPKPQQRRVSFSENVNVQETLHLNDFSEEEYQLYWINNEEQDVILSMADITTELMTMGAMEDGQNVCFRGLEGRSEEANLEYSDKYLSLVEALIVEQDESRAYSTDGRPDHERIAALYQAWTQSCKEIAWFRAQQDEYHVHFMERCMDNAGQVADSAATVADIAAHAMEINRNTMVVMPIDDQASR